MTVLLSKDRYLSQAVAIAERERLWPRVWMHAAPLDRLREPGNFLVVELGGADILLIRGRDGVARAFHNVCPHRGRRLFDAACGTTKAILCPMHNWQWRTDGTLTNVPQRECFADLPESAFALHDLRCEEWAGQLWIHFGEPEQSLREWLGPITKSLDHYELEKYVLVEELTYQLECNWKTLMDLSAEAYHLAAVHPYLFGMIDVNGIVQEEHGQHMLKTLPLGRPTANAVAPGINEALAHLLEENGVDPATLEDDVTRVPDALRAAMRARGIERLSDEELLLIKDWFVFPALNINAFAHELMIHRFRPCGTDPERMLYDLFKFQRPVPGEERRPFRRIFVKDAEKESHSPFTEDDIRQAINVQRGMRSPAFRHAQLGGLESFLISIHARIDEYLARP